MSLINSMLRDLDRREAMAEGQLPPGQVRAVPPAPAGRQWFWSIIAALMLAALAWVGWVAYQVHARPTLATDLAFKAAQELKARPVAQQPPPPAPAAAVAQAAPPETRDAEPAPEPPELFRLAQLIETPIPALKPQAAQAEPRRAAPAPAELPARLAIGAGNAPGATSVNRRDIPRSPAEQAEAQFRQGVTFLNQGRISEAHEQFAAAIARHPSHQAARQALVSILIERGRLDEAKRLLEDGLALNPGNLQFTTVLARILVERRDYRSAANLLSTARDAGESDPDYQLLLGAVLQHLGRHAEATAAFEKAASMKPQPGTTWLALALSLEASGRKPDALEAYRRSLAGNALTQEARSYAEARIRSLR